MHPKNVKKHKPWTLRCRFSDQLPVVRYNGKKSPWMQIVYWKSNRFKVGGCCLPEGRPMNGHSLQHLPMIVGDSASFVLQPSNGWERWGDDVVRGRQTVSWIEACDAGGCEPLWDIINGVINPKVAPLVWHIVLPGRHDKMFFKPMISMDNMSWYTYLPKQKVWMTLDLRLGQVALQVYPVVNGGSDKTRLYSDSLSV